MKKVIFLLIDSLMPSDLENIVKSGKSKGLKFLFEHGYYSPECVTAFPTMTASVDATLMTGVYPDQHRIPGLIWYKSDERRLIDYVNGAKTVFKLGVKNTAKDALINLNKEHLSTKVKTIFEELTARGKTSASINFIIHRGNNKYKLKLPLILNLTTGFKLKNKQINGPELFSLGAMCKPRLPGRKISWNYNQSIFKGFGINDAYATQVTKYIISSGHQPDVMFIYLPDHDHFLHKHINQPLKSLGKIDKFIVEILNLFGTWEKAIKENVFIIIGDHGQTKVGKEQEHNIDLDKLLKDFKIVPIGKRADKDHEVIIANNERMAYIYPLKKDKEEAIKNSLLDDQRIDFVAWRSGNKIFVSNSSGQKLDFQKGGALIDPYGVNWDINGDFSILDIRTRGNNITFYEYPDALSRLYGSLNSQNEFMYVITSKLSYEFISTSFPTHLGGGSHGSLGRVDSVVPLLISGASREPKSLLRIVDLKDYILQLVNVM